MKKPRCASRTKPVKWQAVIFSVCLFFGIFGCEENDLDKVNRITIDRKNIPAETGKKVQVVYTDSARLKARVFTPSMEKFTGKENNYLEMKKGVKAYFYNKREEKNSTLVADYGIRYINKSKTVVKDDVMVVNKKGDTLETEKLTWDEGKEKIYSNKFVKVKTPEEIIYAKGFESNLSFTEYEFYNIKGTIEVD